MLQPSPTRVAVLYDATPLARYQHVLAWDAVVNGLLCCFSSRRTTFVIETNAMEITDRNMARLFFIGLIEPTLINGRLHLPFKARYDQLGRVNLTTYIKTQNPEVLLDKSYVETAGSPKPVLRRVFDEPRFKPYLPPELTSPVRLLTARRS